MIWDFLPTIAVSRIWIKNGIAKHPGRTVFLKPWYSLHGWLSNNRHLTNKHFNHYLSLHVTVVTVLLIKPLLSQTYIYIYILRVCMSGLRIYPKLFSHSKHFHILVTPHHILNCMQYFRLIASVYVITESY